MTPEQINEFFSFLYEGRVDQITWWLRLVAGVLTSAFAAAIVVITIKYRELMAGAPKIAVASEPKAPSPEVAAKPWQEILAKLESPNPADWNLAVIQADAVFDGVLKDMGLAGQTMGDRLKRLDRSKLSALDDVWEAHKLRNRIAHETDRTLTHEEVRRTVELFAKALHELGYLH